MFGLKTMCKKPDFIKKSFIKIQNSMIYMSNGYQGHLTRAEDVTAIENAVFS